MHAEPRRLTGGANFKYKLFCTSCATCRKQLSQYRAKGEAAPGKAWNAIVSYNIASNTLTRSWTPLDHHGDLSFVSTWSQLTSTAEAAVITRLNKPGKVTLQEVKDIIYDLQDTMPDDAWLKTFQNNHRPTKRSTQSGTMRSKGIKWCEADWASQRRIWQNFDEAVAAWKAAGWSEVAVPDHLTLVSLCTELESTSAIYCNPAVAREVILRLANRGYVKLVGDGTFRIFTDQWILITVGVASKHYAEGEEDRSQVFRTTYTPLIFAIVNKENKENYVAILRDVKHVARALTGDDWEQVVRQYHCDWHKGEELARQQELPNSVRCGDWAHFVGATARPKAPAVVGDKAEVEQCTAWRAGVFATIRKHLRPRNKELEDTIRAWLKVMRVLPTCLLFHTISEYLFQTLLAYGEVKCVEALKRHYFVKLPAGIARD